MTRVAFAFAAAVAITALALALSAYYFTKGAQDARALDEALDQSRLNLLVADASLPANPDVADYEALMSAFQIRGDFATLLETGSETYRSGFEVSSAPISQELAEAVAGGNIRYQTVPVAGETTVVVGSQLRSGTVTVYFFFPQGDRLAELTTLRNILIAAGLVLAALGALGGYLLARRLLRPVSQASKAAVRMSQGDLDIRLPTGPDEFGLLGSSFNQMAANLRARMLDLEAGQARERRFVADVTHELRTPVAALVGEASLLEAKLEGDPSSCTPEVRRLAELVGHDIARLRQLVDDLLEISRLEAQAADRVLEPVEVGVFVSRLVQAHGWSRLVQVSAVTATTATAVAPAAPGGAPGASEACGPDYLVMADKRRLERILVNLIENALTHGGAPVKVESRLLDTAAPDPRIVAIAVTDSGAGVPIEHLPHIFDRFYKVDPSRSSGRGSGLGLSIARENARLLGGDLTVSNIPGGGARFVLTLPLVAL